MLKLFGSLGLHKEAEPHLPNCTLTPTSHLLRGKAVLQGQAGVPTTADGLAYDPVQRLLAVSAAAQAAADLWRRRAGQPAHDCPPSPLRAAGQHQRWPRQSFGAGRRRGAAGQCPVGPCTHTAAAVCPQQGGTRAAGPGRRRAAGAELWHVAMRVRAAVSKPGRIEAVHWTAAQLSTAPAPCFFLCWQSGRLELFSLEGLAAHAVDAAAEESGSLSTLEVPDDKVRLQAQGSNKDRKPDI